MKGSKPAVVFGKIGREGLRGSGNTVSSSSLQLIDVCGCKQLVVYTVFSISTAPGTNRRKKKTEDYGEKKHKFILQIKLVVFLSDKFFL